ncbi:UpxY family transcription antiterminator [Chitinophaga solisilvae]|uniref:UpxY family transcription antiterminator n=1 Tax=Chitinophaga solisilvae TaxID=1233460 RepID=A0A3S1D0W1_9BACT|nr:UpxY family transcription antiterminator [Chitinophaga solisilvae]NSL87223.1 UpxY family transcription antiterminator [Chitinophaga solisilvae]
MSFVPGWYLLYTKPKHERKVALQLTRMNISLFLPESKVVKQWHDRKKVIEAPLFPSYVFVFVDKMEHYYNSLDCDGVLYWVRFGKEIARVREETINSLRFLVNEGRNLEVSSERFNPGQKLVIHRGAFSGLDCEVVEHRNDKKVLVRIKILNRNVLADLSHSLIA